MWSKLPNSNGNSASQRLARGKSRVSRNLAMPERLEQRQVFAAAVYLDFGQAFPNGQLFVDNATMALAVQRSSRIWAQTGTR